MSYTPQQAQQLFNNLRRHSAPSAASPKLPRAALRRRREMNKTETEFSHYLTALRMSGEILSWQFEAIKLHIGGGCYYTPDFLCLTNGKPLLIEVKGAHAWSRDRVRFKVAADAWLWMFDFAYWQKLNGQWLRA